MSERERLSFDSKIQTPPPWADPDDISEEAAADDGAAFMDAFNSGGRGVRT
jgi:hypothetical protein